MGDKEPVIRVMTPEEVGVAAFDDIAKITHTLLSWPEYEAAAARSSLDPRTVDSGLVSFLRGGTRYIVKADSVLKGASREGHRYSQSLIVHKGEVTVAYNYEGVYRDEAMKVERGAAELQTEENRLVNEDAFSAAHELLPELY